MSNATPHRPTYDPVWQRRLARASEGLSSEECLYLTTRVVSMSERELNQHLKNRSTQQIRAWLDDLLADRGPTEEGSARWPISRPS